MRVTGDQALQCCASLRFAELLSGQQHSTTQDLIQAARTIWWNQVDLAGWLEAFAAHPRIGDLEGLKKKFGGFADMSKSEQSSAGSASEKTIQDLLAWNKNYEAKFGHIFIICASGRSADFMLSAIKERYLNTPYKELSLAACEQMKITELRLKKLLDPEDKATEAGEQIERRSGQLRSHLDGKPLVSPVTSHVLDTARGSPAEGVDIVLERKAEGSEDIWDPVASGTTNSDGRLPTFMRPSDRIEPGIYKVTFKTGRYMQRCKQRHPDFYAESAFYPLATVQFSVTEETCRQHFHIPLTWNPYGYSTYRGS